MDTLQIEQAAQHLASLGCTAEQIERHLKPLRAHADKTKQPQQAEQPKRQPTTPTTYELTRDQIEPLLAKLRERKWRWAVWQVLSDDSANHAVLAVTGAPNSKSEALYLIGAVLSQLKRLGLIRKVSNGRGGYWVQVVEKPQRMPRERLHPAEQPQIGMSAGSNGSGHSRPAASVPAKTQPTSAAAAAP